MHLFTFTDLKPTHSLLSNLLGYRDLQTYITVFIINCKMFLIKLYLYNTHINYYK